MCRVGVCTKGRCSSMAIGLSNDGKCMFNNWCDTVVHFEVRLSRFWTVSKDNRRYHGGTSLKHAVVLQR